MCGGAHALQARPTQASILHSFVFLSILFEVNSFLEQLLVWYLVRVSRTFLSRDFCFVLVAFVFV